MAKVNGQNWTITQCSFSTMFSKTPNQTSQLVNQSPKLLLRQKRLSFAGGTDTIVTTEEYSSVDCVAKKCMVSDLGKDEIYTGFDSGTLVGVHSSLDFMHPYYASQLFSCFPRGKMFFI